MIPYDLSTTEQQMIEVIAQERHAKNRKYGVRDRRIMKDPLLIDRVGSAGEYIFSVLTGLEWIDPLAPDIYKHHREKRPDVGPFEVRTATAFHHGLLAHDEDRAPVYALVLAHRYPTLWFAGWTTASIAKDQQYWADWLETPCYRVPRSVLYSPEQVCLPSRLPVVPTQGTLLAITP